MKSTIIVIGNIPSKKNSKRIFCRGKYPTVLPSKKHEEWHEELMWQLKGQKKIENIEKINITFYPSTKRKADLTNKAESIMDLLVDADIIEDDNWFVVGELNLIFGGKDKENPRAEIEIWTTKNMKT